MSQWLDMVDIAPVRRLPSAHIQLPRHLIPDVVHFHQRDRVRQVSHVVAHDTGRGFCGLRISNVSSESTLFDVFGFHDSYRRLLCQERK